MPEWCRLASSSPRGPLTLSREAASHEVAPAGSDWYDSSSLLPELELELELELLRVSAVDGPGKALVLLSGRSMLISA